MIPLALPTVASLTPVNYDIRIIDEEIEDLPEALPDIVGITTLAATADRAFELGDMYRVKGCQGRFRRTLRFLFNRTGTAALRQCRCGRSRRKMGGCLADFEQGPDETCL